MNSVYRLLEHFASGNQYVQGLIAEGTLTKHKMKQALIEFANFLPSEVEEINDTISIFVKDQR